MIISNWVAIMDGAAGLAFPRDFSNGLVRIYGNIYGHPDFKDGEYVRTALIARYDGVKVTTEANEDITLLREAVIYTYFLQAAARDILILKNWRVEDGCIVGTTLEAKKIKGRIVRQCLTNNICQLSDGTKVFVDWLSKDPNFNPDKGPEEFLVFATERCMPDVFGKHFCMFRKK